MAGYFDGIGSFDKRAYLRVYFNDTNGVGISRSSLVVIGDVFAFQELRLKRHPLMIRAILVSDGLPLKHTRSELEAHASRLALVILHPLET